MLQVKSVIILKLNRGIFETWWCNKDAVVTMGRKRELFRIWRQSWNEENKKYC